MVPAQTWAERVGRGSTRARSERAWAGARVGRARVSRARAAEASVSRARVTRAHVTRHVRCGDEMKGRKCCAPLFVCMSPLW